jgi:hypothetical protein
VDPLRVVSLLRLSIARARPCSFLHGDPHARL